ncbi:MAG TPA: M56 family metallopeptidase [Thermoanaerobaculia bacterium]|nr:M56 family metallopeptidase [Thermoanaerobaculia bacterium]
MRPETLAVDLAAIALNVAGKGALLALATLLALAALRRASAASRHLLLALAAAALVLLPALAWLLPARELELLPAASEPLAAARTAQVASGPDTTVPAVPARSSAAAAREVEAPRGTPFDWRTAALAAGFFSLAVSALLLLRLAVAVRRLASLRSGAQPAPAAWQELFAECRQRLGVTQEVGLAVSPAVAVPVTFGLRRPLVLLPAGAGAWEAPSLREALLHELAHVERRDWPVQLLARVACALHWFDPLAWALERRLLLEAERACDDRVLGAGAAATAYAGRLVTLARETRGPRHGNPAATVAFARPAGLATRVTAILDSGISRCAPGRAAVAVAVTAAAFVLLAVAPARVVRAEGAPERPERETEGDRHDRDDEDDDSWRDAIRDGVVEGRREAMLEAARDGEADAVRFFLDRGADPNGFVRGDGTPLLVAAAEGHEEVVQVLLAAGADPNFPAPGDGSALIVAAREGRLEVARLLLAAGADVDLVVDGDENPLIQAAWEGELEMVRLLLDAGADPNARVLVKRTDYDSDGVLRTPLRMAHRGGHEAVERLLRERGATD